MKNPSLRLFTKGTDKKDDDQNPFAVPTYMITPTTNLPLLIVENIHWVFDDKEDEEDEENQKAEEAVTKKSKVES